MDETKVKLTLGSNTTQKNGTSQIVDLPSVSKQFPTSPSSPSRNLKLSLASSPQLLSVSTLRGPEQQTTMLMPEESLYKKTSAPSIMDTQPDPVSKDAYRLLTDAMPFREQVVGTDDRRGEAFVPIDTHHFNEKDFQAHRESSYPHMHAPLKPLKTTSRDKVKTKHKQRKRKDPEDSNDTDQEIVANKARRQKHGRPHAQPEGFKPSLNSVDEANRDDDHSSSTLSNDDHTNDTPTPTPQDIDTKVTDTVQPNRGNFYAAFASENPSTSFLETLKSVNTQPALNHDPLEANTKMNVPLPRWGSDIGRVNSMGQTLPDIIEGEPLEVSVLDGKVSGDRKVSFGHRPTASGVRKDKKADFVLGMSSEDLHQNPETSAEPIHRHHSKEYFSPKDLQQRQHSGAELRQISERHNVDPDEQVTSVADDIISHRTGEYRGIRQHKIQPHAYIMRRSTSYDSQMHYDTMKEQLSSNRMYGVKKAPSNFRKPSLPHAADAMNLSRNPRQPSISFSHQVKPVLIELDSLEYHQRHQQWYWQEVARWLYQEEDYYAPDNTFSAAHSSVLSFEAIIRLQKHLENALISLDIFRPTTLVDLVNTLVDEFIVHGMCKPDDRLGLRDTLLLYHKHVGEKYTKDEVKALGSVVSTTNMLELLGHDGLPLDNRRGSNNTGIYSQPPHKSFTVGQMMDNMSNPPYSRQQSHADEVQVHSHSMDYSKGSFSRMQSLVENDHISGSSIWAPIIPQHHFHSRLRARLPPNTEAAIVQVGVVKRLQRPLCAFVRLADDFHAEGVTEVDTLPLRFIFILLVPLDYSVEPIEVGRVFASLLVNKDFRARVYTAQYREDIISSVASVLTSTVVIPLSKHITKEGLNGMMEQILKFRRKMEEKEHTEKERKKKISYDVEPQRLHVGHKIRSATTACISHPTTCRRNIRTPTHRALTSHELLGMSDVSNAFSEERELLLPTVSVTSHGSNAEVKAVAGGELVLNGAVGSPNGDQIKLPAFHDEMPVISEEDLYGTKTKSSCAKRCSSLIGHYPFYNLWMDISRGFIRRYPSDWIDVFRPTSHIPIVFTGSLFVYFTILAPAITFGALLSTQVNPAMTVALTIFSSGIACLIMVLFGGQPFFVPGPTGPVYIIETVATSFALSLNTKVEYLRFYIGLYTAIIGVILLFFNASRIIRLLRNSTAEIFNAFIAFFFLLKALFSMFKPVPLDTPSLYGPLNCTNCSLFSYCSDQSKNYQLIDGRYVCIQKWMNMGQQTCGMVLAVIMLFICLFLVEIKRGRYLRRRARFILGSLNVPIGILITSIFAWTVFKAYQVPTLNIPISVDPSTLIAIPNFSMTFSTGVAGNGMFQGYAIVLAVCLTMIIFTESAMTSVIVAGPQRKLVKTPCYTLDLFIMLVVLPLLSACLGWPFMSGAVVRAFVHTIAMTKWDDKTPPGVPHKIIGAAEQRLSGVISSSLTALSVVLGVILRLIPVHAMYGMFLYMGIMGLRELHMKRRLITLMKRRKNWSDHDHLRGIPRYQMLLFVLTVWFFCLVMVTLNIISEFLTTATWTAILFPLVVVIYMLTRELVMPKIPWLNPFLEKMDKLPSVVLVPPKHQKKATIEPMESVSALASTDAMACSRKASAILEGSVGKNDATLHDEVCGVTQRDRTYSVERESSTDSDSSSEEAVDRRDVEFFYRTVTA